MKDEAGGLHEIRTYNPRSPTPADPAHCDPAYPTAATHPEFARPWRRPGSSYCAGNATRCPARQSSVHWTQRCICLCSTPRTHIHPHTARVIKHKRRIRTHGIAQLQLSEPTGVTVTLTSGIRPHPAGATQTKVLGRIQILARLLGTESCKQGELATGAPSSAPAPAPHPD
jgi:hypothetical protein